MSPPAIAPGGKQCRTGGIAPTDHAAGPALGGDNDGDAELDRGAQRIEEPTGDRAVPPSLRLEVEPAQTRSSEHRAEDVPVEPGWSRNPVTASLIRPRRRIGPGLEAPDQGRLELDRDTGGCERRVVR
jgi:hypothetical protein